VSEDVVNTFISILFIGSRFATQVGNVFNGDP